MTAARARWLSLLVAGAGIACWLLWSPLGANEVVGGDEGYYGVMARSILVSPRYLLSPPLTPLGPPGDKPPLYPAVLALSIRGLGVNEVALRWPSTAAAAGIALALILLLGRSAGGAGALAAGAFFVSLPWLADASRVCSAEPILTAFGAVALVLVTAAHPSRGRDALAGTLLGAAFLCKLWLVALVALPAAVAVAPWTSSGLRRLALVAGVAIATAGLHLAAVALFQPAALAHWREIYFGFSLAGRASGEGFAAPWLLPPAAYWNLLAHALALLMPLVAIGVADAARRWREPVPRMLLVWAGGAAILSVFAVKSGGYAYAVMPAWVGLAALGLAALGEGRVISPMLPLVGAALVAPPLAARWGGAPIPLLPWAAASAATLAAWAVARLKPRLAWPAAAALGIAITLAGFAREAQRLPQRYHVPGLRPVAAAIAPILADAPPGRACFVAPEAPALAYYLFRTGGYWATPIAPWTAERLAALEADTAVRVFVVDPRQELYGGWPDSATAAWLETETVERNPAPASRSAGSAGQVDRLRVFVRRP